MHYWLSSTLFYNFIYSAHGGRRDQPDSNRTAKVWQELRWLFRHLDEQRRIAEFLDAETARIDLSDKRSTTRALTSSKKGLKAVSVK